MKLPVNYESLDWMERKTVREEYVKLQGNKCCYCGQDLDKNPDSSVRNKYVPKDLFPSNFFKWPVHLHHNHTTGMTKGAVHCYCNAVLWYYYGE